MKKILALVVVLAMAGGAWFYFDKPASIEVEGEKPVIKIGAVLPLQGAYEMYGDAGKKSLMMLQEDLKSRDLKNNYELLIEPSDANDLRTGVNAARKIVLVDKVDAVITVWNNAGVATTEVVKGKNVIHFNLGNDARTTIEKHNFNFGPSADGQVNLSLSEMKKMGVNKLALIGVNNAWSTSIIEEYKKLASKYDIEVTNVEIVNAGEKDFNIILANIVAKKPDMIAHALENPETDIVRKRMLEKGIDIPVTTVESTEYTEDSVLYEGTWYVNYPDGTEDFLKRFSEFSGMNTYPTVAYVYDMASLIVDAFENSDNAEDAVKYLRSLEVFNGATGEVKQEENFFKTKDVIKKVKNGKLVFVD